MIGTTIGNYVIREKIGEGGMGAVYVAEHARLGRRVAVKVLLPHLGRSADIVARFFNEAKAATDIKNEHIIDVLDFGELADGSSYIVMEWLEGKSLADLLRDERLPAARAVHIAGGIGKALAAAHTRGIVHRDLKPDNVFLIARDGDPDFVKVLDFGIAKLTGGNAGDVRTQTGAVMGTPLYMAPEQINGAQVDARTDVYAFGIMLYQMFAGSLPFPATTLTELLLAHATKTPPRLRQIDPAISPAIESAVARALEKDPARRFSSVDELVRALEAPVEVPVAPTANGPVSALASTGFAAGARTAPSVPSAPRANATPFVWIGVGVVALLAVVGAIIAVVAFHGHTAAPAPTEAITTTATATLTATADMTATATETPSAATSAAIAPAPSTSSSAKKIDHWQLTQTTCPTGAMPSRVETTHDGAKFVSRAPGYPAASGTTDAAGRFHIVSREGTCNGKAGSDEVTETCTNPFHQSCTTTYRRVTP